MSETERRLKDHLDANQAMRERMCLEILSVQDDYTDIRPRLPKGGPDGGRDLQGHYKEDLFFGAVGFVNGATDLAEHRKQIQKKFKEDLKSALQPKKDDSPQAKGFVFLTNVGLTPGIIASLKKHAYAKGISFCDIFDRERLRIVLDSNRGYVTRFRYLDIPLSDAEQKEFFSAWADEINSAISSGLTGLDQRTKRIQFLLESQALLDSLWTVIELDTSIWDACKGEFFFQTMITLRVHVDGLLGFTFGGGTDEIVETLEQQEAHSIRHPKNKQYGFGYSWLLPGTPQHQQYADYVKNPEHPKNSRVEENIEYIRTSGSSGILEVGVPHLYFRTLSEPFLDRFQPTCKMIDLDRSMIGFECSGELADHIEKITIVGGGYELLVLSKSDFQLNQGSFDHLKIPVEAKQDEESHDWVRLRPSDFASFFTIDLMSQTPRRYDW
ncbi:hypothetical protein [Ruegeria arenilitoris]|uniref:hypothetical protein n=1 Tax=Ruegeria arenilitoris TaxID=1173585 RepID=UPI00147DF51B|nr:hypothetical protein [Ruegeria arenilitoris]